jgi:hypothetical protein
MDATLTAYTRMQWHIGRVRYMVGNLKVEGPTCAQMLLARKTLQKIQAKMTETFFAPDTNLICVTRSG